MGATFDFSISDVAQRIHRHTRIKPFLGYQKHLQCFSMHTLAWVKSICSASVGIPWPGSKCWCCAGTEGFPGMPRDQKSPFLAPRNGYLSWKEDGGARHVGSFSALQGQSCRVIIRAVILISHGECCSEKQCKKLELLFLFLRKTVRTAMPAWLCILSPA